MYGNFMRYSRLWALFIVICPATLGFALAGGNTDCCKAPKTTQVSELTEADGMSVRPELSDGRPLVGPATAPVTIVEYGDFLCPFTNRSRSAVNALLHRHKQQVRYYFKVFPLGVHGEIAGVAAQYFEAVVATKPALAWPYFNDLFDHQERIRREGRVALRDLTAKMNINLHVVDEELLDPDNRNQVIADITEAQSFDFISTPTFVINGRVIEGEVSEIQLEKAFQIALRNR